MGEDDFKAFVEGTLDIEGHRFKELLDKGFIAGGVDARTYRELYWRRRERVFYGPNLHEIALTERSSVPCIYSRASNVAIDAEGADMSAETAERCIDFALQTTSDNVMLRFTGGEPLASWDILVHAVEYAQQQNKVCGKHLSFSVETDLSLMTDERLAFLASIGAQICTALDGPQALHDGYRPGFEGSAWAVATTWIEKINKASAAADPAEPTALIDAQVTVTGRSLGQAKEIVDTYVALGCTSIAFAPIHPADLPDDLDETLGCDTDAYVAFYSQALDHIFSLNARGVALKDELGAVILAKLHGRRDPNYLDLRSPGGSAIGQLRYQPSGAIYSSSEGQNIAVSGDEFFLLGHVDDVGFRDLIDSPKVRALVLASTNDAAPGCVSCAYKPYCGLQPELAYATQGSIQGRMRESEWCRRHIGIFDDFVRRRRDATEEEKELIMAWVAEERVTPPLLQGAGVVSDRFLG